MATTQDIASSVRPVVFTTGLEEFPLATHGGTMFVIEYGGKAYAVSCAHVLRGFNPADLIVTQSQIPQYESQAATCQGLYYASEVGGEAIESDIDDICILDFSEGVTSAFFGGAAFAINDETAGSSESGHELHVFGVLKSTTEIQSETVNIGYCLLDFSDIGQPDRDKVLRSAEGNWENKSITSIAGISGSPVLDISSGKLCGMVARGTVNNGRAIIHFIDIFHILAFLRSSVGGAGPILYEFTPQR